MTALIPRSTGARLALALAGVAGLALVILVAMPPDADAALVKMAGQGSSKGSFGKVYDYLDSLGKGLLPLAVPAAIIGCAAGGFLHMGGHQLAGKVFGGVALGTAAVLLAPTIIA